MRRRYLTRKDSFRTGFAALRACHAIRSLLHALQLLVQARRAVVKQTIQHNNCRWEREHINELAACVYLSVNSSISPCKDSIRLPYASRVRQIRSEEHTSELQSLMRISYAVFCLKKKNTSDLIKAPI